MSVVDERAIGTGVLFSGTANRPLAESIANRLGVGLGECLVGRFPDGEVSVQVLESVVREDVFLVQPTSPPVNDHLMELLALAVGSVYS